MDQDRAAPKRKRRTTYVDLTLDDADVPPVAKGAASAGKGRASSSANMVDLTGLQLPPRPARKRKRQAAAVFQEPIPLVSPVTAFCPSAGAIGDRRPLSTGAMTVCSSSSIVVVCLVQLQRWTLSAAPLLTGRQPVTGAPRWGALRFRPAQCTPTRPPCAGGSSRDLLLRCLVSILLLQRAFIR